MKVLLKEIYWNQLSKSNKTWKEHEGRENIKSLNLETDVKSEKTSGQI